MIYLLIFMAFADESKTRTISVKDLGEISLPSGKWTVEDFGAKNKINRPICILRKGGDRLERLSVQRFESVESFPVATYFDSIGDSTSQGVPDRLLEQSARHESVEILRDLHTISTAGGIVTCMGASYLHTAEAIDPWMDHVVICRRGRYVYVLIHSSPYAISASVVRDVLDDSTLEE